MLDICLIKFFFQFIYILFYIFIFLEGGCSVTFCIPRCLWFGFYFCPQTVVYIVVGDVNDNAPLFNPLNYSVSVYENSPLWTPLVNVTATDADTLQNAKITYSVTSGDQESVFTVDTEVGRFSSLRLEFACSANQHPKSTIKKPIYLCAPREFLIKSVRHVW